MRRPMLLRQRQMHSKQQLTKKALKKGDYLQGNNAISLDDLAPLREEKRGANLLPALQRQVSPKSFM